jgi:hypothetical protein
VKLNDRRSKIASLVFTSKHICYPSSGPRASASQDCHHSARVTAMTDESLVITPHVVDIYQWYRTHVAGSYGKLGARVGMAKRNSLAAV